MCRCAPSALRPALSPPAPSSRPGAGRWGHGVSQPFYDIQRIISPCVLPSGRWCSPRGWLNSVGVRWATAQQTPPLSPAEAVAYCPRVAGAPLGAGSIASVSDGLPPNRHLRFRQQKPLRTALGSLELPSGLAQ